MFSAKLTRSIAIGLAAIAIGGGAYGIVSATAGNSSATTTTATRVPGRAGFGGGGSNARSGPAAGGTVGTVAGVSTASFTITTAAGQKVTVTKASSTTYRKGASSISASALKKGQNVLVLGIVNGTTIAASQVIVQTTAASGTSTAKVVPFQRGAPSTSKQVGVVPANYTQGSGTIVGGTTANKATEAALAAYPGGVVDRVVKLSNGEYEVHNIGVNWPHHIFVSQSFKVVGAN
jgi:membrane-bound inhibitor of C-type lysozyme